MIKHPEYVTVSLAKTYASQGHIQKALELYRHLLQNAPDDQTLKNTIFELENADPAVTGQTFSKKKDLAGLFESWVEWTLKYKKIRALKRLKSRIFP
ncbi:MAG: hypothetical protein ABIK15_08860 [Pseudomonadota bacterium]